MQRTLLVLLILPLLSLLFFLHLIPPFVVLLFPPLLLLCLLLLCPVSTCQLFWPAGNELDIAEKTPARQWVAGFYFAVMLITTTGLGDMKPCTPAEEILGSAQMLLGVFLFGLIISTSQ